MAGATIRCQMRGGGAQHPGRDRRQPDVARRTVFNILATFAEFEVDLLRLRTREGMAVARAKGKLEGKRPKLAPRQQTELTRMHATGEYTVADLREVFSVGRATAYRTSSAPLRCAS